MRYVLGAGLSGLLWALYHPGYTVVSDRIGLGVVGSEPQVYLRQTALTRDLMDRLGLPQPRVVTKRVVYYTLSGIKEADDLRESERQRTRNKNMAQAVIRLKKRNISYADELKTSEHNSQSK